MGTELPDPYCVLSHVAFSLPSSSASYTITDKPEIPSCLFFKEPHRLFCWEAPWTAPQTVNLFSYCCPAPLPSSKLLPHSLSLGFCLPQKLQTPSQYFSILHIITDFEHKQISFSYRKQRGQT